MYTVSQSRKARIALVAGLTVAAVAGVNPVAHAQDTIYGFTTGGSLFRFASNAPGTTTSLGTLSGITGTLQDIDFRANNSLLYGLSVSGTTFNLYTISTANGAASFITSLTGVAASGAATTYDIDFNPSANALRIVGDNGDNFRVPAAQIGTGLGATTTDTALSGGNGIVGVAYTNNVAQTGGATTLYDVSNTGTLYTQGSPNGTPNSPNGGGLIVVGSTGVTAADLGFDISGITSNAYLAANNTFYTVNLATGSAGTGTAINTTGLSGAVRGISAAAAPEPGALALLGSGLVSLGGVAVRRRMKKA